MKHTMDYSKEQEVIKLYQSTNSKTTREFFNLSNGLLYSTLKKYNIATKAFKKDEIITLKMVSLHENGKNNKEISEELGCSVDCVADTLKIRGLNKYTRKKQIEYNPFENYLNPHVQYWLGVLATDGCLGENNKIALSQCEQNKDIIEKFQHFLQDKVNIREYIEKKFNKEFKRFTISFRNENVFNYLSNIIGITPRKTFTIKMKIPITFDFLRGAIEGDGSISVKTHCIRLCSASKDFIDQISELLNKFEIKHGIYTIKRVSALYDLQVNEHSSVLKLLDFLYYNDCTFLERKYNNAQQIRNYLHTRFKFRELSLENPERNPQDIEEIYTENM